MTMYGWIAAIEAEIEQPDDVGVVELGAGAAFAEETLADFRRRPRRRLHHLQRDIVTETDAAGAVHLAHAAGAESINDLVSIVDLRAWRQHARSLYRSACYLVGRWQTHGYVHGSRRDRSCSRAS